MARRFFALLIHDRSVPFESLKTALKDLNVGISSVNSLEAAKRLGVPPGACVVVEDSERGVRAARAAGMRCVAVPCAETRHHDFTDATLVLPGLPDLLRCALFAER